MEVFRYDLAVLTSSDQQKRESQPDPGLIPLAAHYALFHSFPLENAMEDTVQGLQLHSLSAASKRVKEETNKVAMEHKELHAYVSKVGKSIDRVCLIFTSKSISRLKLTRFLPFFT